MNVNSDCSFGNYFFINIITDTLFLLIDQNFILIRIFSKMSKKYSDQRNFLTEKS
jgi:hypothetical protein